ncbi:Peptidase S8 domain-containing protein [Forsythia ovata]|uniref:Peptidase S8 domain-containing protein n=1 Tax=Forsythia ovata TaxID=205694 RepID=A0ABD1TP72_9LAMI
MRVRLELIEQKIQRQCTVHQASTRLSDEFFTHQSSTTATTDAEQLSSYNLESELAKKKKNRLRSTETVVHSQNTLDNSTKTVPISIPQPTSLMPKSSLTLLLIVIVIALADAEKHRKTFIICIERDAKPSIFPIHKHWYESTLRLLSTIAIDGMLSDSTDVGSCWNAGCYDSDTLAAFDVAMTDGVDVISLSIGEVVVPYYLDAIAIGAFGASDVGISCPPPPATVGPKDSQSPMSLPGSPLWELKLSIVTYLPTSSSGTEK